MQGVLWILQLQCMKVGTQRCHWQWMMGLSVRVIAGSSEVCVIWQGAEFHMACLCVGWVVRLLMFDWKYLETTDSPDSSTDTMQVPM